MNVTGALERTELLCEGPAATDEVTGSIQVDFLARRPMGPATEVAVLVNDPALSVLAEALGRERSPDFDIAVARAVGRAWIELRHARQGRFEPILMVSRATLAAYPELIEAGRAVAT